MGSHHAGAEAAPPRRSRGSPRSIRRHPAQHCPHPSADGNASSRNHTAEMAGVLALQGPRTSDGQKHTFSLPCPGEHAWKVLATVPP